MAGSGTGCGIGSSLGGPGRGAGTVRGVVREQCGAWCATGADVVRRVVWGVARSAVGAERGWRGAQLAGRARGARARTWGDRCTPSASQRHLRTASGAECIGITCSRPPRPPREFARSVCFVRRPARPSGLSGRPSRPVRPVRSSVRPFVLSCPLGPPRPSAHQPFRPPAQCGQWRETMRALRRDDCECEMMIAFHKRGGAAFALYERLCRRSECCRSEERDGEARGGGAPR